MPQGNYLNAFRGPDLAQIDRDAYSNALTRNDVQRLPQQNRAQDLNIQGAELDIGNAQQKGASDFLIRSFSLMAQDPNRAHEVINSQAFQAASKALQLPAFSVDGETPETIAQKSTGWAQAISQKGEQQTTYGQPFEYDGALLQADNTGKLNSVLNRPPQPASQPAPDREVVAIKGPDGNPIYVTRDQAVGKEPWQKPTGGLSPRDATTARNKLTSIALARQQLNNARANFEKIQGTFSAGPAGGFMPTEAGKAFDASIDMMRGTISGLKRVPGVGSMSDYEGRLDQSMLPVRGAYEATTLQKLNDLDMFLNYLEQGYGGILQDNGDAAQTPGGGSGSGKWSIVEVTK